jgi:hypothetical protein
MEHHEHTVLVPRLYTDAEEPRLEIGVDKVGGGTLPRAYDGYWDVYYYVNGVLKDATRITTSMPKTHHQVAVLTAQYVADSIEEVDDMDTYDRLMWFVDAFE